MKTIAILLATCFVFLLSTPTASAQRQERTAYLDSLETKTYELASFLLQLAQAGLIDLQRIIDANSNQPNGSTPPAPPAQQQPAPIDQSNLDVANAYERASIRETVEVTYYHIGTQESYGHLATNNDRFSFNARGTLFRSFPDIPVTEPGIVTVFFHVNTSGQVLDPIIVESNTTLSSSTFRDAALDAARKTVYEPRSNGDEYGFVSYVFKKM